MNALGGIYTTDAHPGSFKFGRTVVVTKVWCKKIVTGATAGIYLAMRLASSGTAAMTAFASVKMSVTTGVYCVNRYRAMTQASNKTFLAADVLGFSLKTKKTDGGTMSYLLRYKEK